MITAPWGHYRGRGVILIVDPGGITGVEGL